MATTNDAKLAMVRRAVGGLARVAPPPHDISHQENQEAERESSLIEIAQAKARRVSTLLPGELVVASDGGLLIPALGSAWDPRRTHRFARGRASNRERVEALLRLARGLVGAERRIGWREALAVARDGQVLATWEAEGPPGFLAKDYDPALVDDRAGFWVPAVWICPECGGRRLAALSAAEQASRDDHWARLGRRLRHFLADLPETG